MCICGSIKFFCLIECLVFFFNIFVYFKIILFCVFLESTRKLVKMFKKIRGKGSACIEVASCDIFSIEFHNVMFTQGSQYRRTI